MNSQKEHCTKEARCKNVSMSLTYKAKKGARLIHGAGKGL